MTKLCDWPVMVIEPLTLASRHLPLPPGGSLVFAPVEQNPTPDLGKANRQFSPRRHATFLAGRVAAKEALCKAGFPDAVAPGIGTDGLPDWPHGWLGSISHCDDVAAAVVAPDDGALILGFDLERIVTTEVATQIAPEVMPELPAVCSELPLEQKITCAFSAKEALYKALYPITRQFRDFSAARIGWQDDESGKPPRIMLTLTEDWGAGWTAGTVFEAFQTTAAGHIATIVWR